ncbi:MAG: PAS domain S-box protein [Epsilonproteobacteria bacterium]|nr:PAS domain S-box protein [Campylobacterota bacterium]
MALTNSIAYKTALAISISLIIIMSIVGVYVYQNQIKIIDELKTQQKDTILKYITKQEDLKIHYTTNQLKTLSQSLVSGVANALYNSDVNSALKTLQDFLQNSHIKAVNIYDDTVGENFLTVVREKGRLVHAHAIPKSFVHYPSFAYPLVVDGEKIGMFRVYYDISHIISDIKKLKQQEINALHHKMDMINQEINQSFIRLVLIFIIASIVIVWLIIFLLKKLVNKPLVSFQQGLNSFFDYLADPTKQVQEIELHTNDEFGQMSKSINKSIQTSVAIYARMVQLMDAMDEYVIFSQTDEDGIITHVSKAFCKISGYSKKELIGKPHSIVGAGDTPKEVFQQMWQTIKSGKLWEGEIKNKTKNSQEYWLYSMVLPTCKHTPCGYTAIRYDITTKKRAEALLAKTKHELEIMHKHVQDSIRYAALIQGAIIPPSGVLTACFADYFVEWSPKDIVGGDIWLFDQIRDSEYLLFVIDCTGHGVPGAFVTMMVKAIQREIMGILTKTSEMEISTSWIMGYFNEAMKKLLRQEEDALANVGFDGGILYYNKKRNIIKFTGAWTSLFYVDDTLKLLKGDRYSVGYKTCDTQYQYGEYTINVHKGMKFYITTDGYLDQNGGDKGFPFGKKRFKQLLSQIHDKPMFLQHKELMRALDQYARSHERNDDITVIGFEV